MASYTENLSLEKPAEDEFYDINKINANMDKIDAAITSSQTETGKKMEHESPEGTGSLSMNRKTSTEKGANSATLGTDGTASGNSAVAEGNITTASGNYSHAEGNRTTASGDDSHAEGANTKAKASCSHAEGGSTTANAPYAHAQNWGTSAVGHSQTVLGKFNIPDVYNAVIVGNGESDTKQSNALTVGWDGSVQSSGRLQSAQESKTVQLSNGASGNLELHRKGDIVSVYTNVVKLGGGTSDRLVATIPEGWRPPIQTMIQLGTSADGLLFIDSDGKVKCRHTSATQQQVFGWATYVAWG